MRLGLGILGLRQTKVREIRVNDIRVRDFRVKVARPSLGGGQQKHKHVLQSGPGLLLVSGLGFALGFALGLASTCSL